MQTNNKSLQYFTLCMLKTQSPNSSPITSTTGWLSVPQESALSHSELSWRRGCTPFAEGVPQISPFQQIRGTELFSIFLASRPCLLSFNAEEKIIKTKGPNSFLRVTLGTQEALVIKQSKRFPNLAEEIWPSKPGTVKYCLSKDTDESPSQRFFLNLTWNRALKNLTWI